MEWKSIKKEKPPKGKTILFYRSQSLPFLKYLDCEYSEEAQANHYKYRNITHWLVVESPYIP